MVLRSWIRLFTFLYVIVACVSGNAWFSRANIFLSRLKRLEFLEGEKVRLAQAVYNTDQVASSLQEENAELKQKSVLLKSSLQNLRKELNALKSEHEKDFSKLTKNHAKSITELRESFKKFRSQEIATITSKLEEEFDVEKEDLLTTLGSSHEAELDVLRESIRSTNATVLQHSKTIQDLKDKLDAKEEEVSGYEQRERQSVLTRDQLIEEIATLSQSLQHIKQAEEARAVDLDGELQVTPVPVAEPVHRPAPAPAAPDSLLTVPAGVTHVSGSSSQHRGGNTEVVGSSSAKPVGRKIGSLRSRRPHTSSSHQQ